MVLVFRRSWFVVSWFVVRGSSFADRVLDMLSGGQSGQFMHMLNGLLGAAAASGNATMPHISTMGGHQMGGMMPQMGSMMPMGGMLPQMSTMGGQQIGGMMPMGV